jgi:hypothetical protein
MSGVKEKSDAAPPDFAGEFHDLLVPGPPRSTLDANNLATERGE